MTKIFKLPLSPAQLYHLRQLVREHSDKGEQGWAVLQQKLDECWLLASQHEQDYGPFPQKEFSEFKRRAPRSQPCR